MIASRTVRWLRKHNNRRGIAVVYLALLLIALLAFVALAVDIGYMYVSKTQLQNAADSASLAGAARLNGTTFTNQTGARLEAQRFAASNRAAGDTVYVDTNDSNISKTNNTYDGDIILGYWDGTTCNTNLPSGKKVDCVKVTARRTNETLPGISNQNKPIPTFFGKVLNISQVGVNASAIAIKVPAKVLPITINEYWRANSDDPTAPTLVPPGQQPYGSNQDYPNSFVRSTNVDPAHTASKVFGLTFALLGSEASDNVPASWAPGASNVNGYVNLDIRTSNHDGSGTSWYEVTTGGFTPLSCATCVPSLFVGPTTVKTGTAVNVKFDSSLAYLMDGFPDNYPFPIAVKEQYTSHYPTTLYSISPTSACPFATVAYFTAGGTQPINKTYNGKKFNDVHPPGSKIIVMVYDGTFRPEADPNSANAITNVGYVPIQIDGYSSGNPKAFLNPSGVTSNIGTDGSSAYGHALTSILEPSTTTGACDAGFFDKLNSMAFLYGTVKLVK
jgi:Flp pilus assembly protein TadG